MTFMKKLMTITLVAICLFTAVYSWAASSSSNMFKYHMHQIFDSYNNAKISFSLRKFDITNIYLKHLLESIDSAEKYMPDKNRDGTKLNKELFTNRMEKLKKDVSSLKFINEVKYRDPLLTEFFSKDISNMCVACHKEVKKDPVFKQPRRTSLFGEFMHKAAENLDLALAMSEDESLSDKAQEHFQLVNYYIDLLAPIFPESGPSGAIMDKELFQKRLAEIKKNLNEEGKAPTTADLKQSIKSINNLCATCHGQKN
jgi:cytochrome c553